MLKNKQIDSQIKLITNQQTDNVRDKDVIDLTLNFS